MSVQNPALFAAAFNTVTEDPELSSVDRLILLAIVSHCQTQGQSVYPSIQGRLDRMTGLTSRAVRNAINGRELRGQWLPGLIERGYLSSADRGIDPETSRHRPHAFALGHRLLGIAEPADPTVGLDSEPGSYQSEPGSYYPERGSDEYRDTVLEEDKTDKPTHIHDRNTYSEPGSDHRSNGYQTKMPGEGKLAYMARTAQRKAAAA